MGSSGKGNLALTVYMYYNLQYIFKKQHLIMITADPKMDSCYMILQAQ